jgi:cell migration-inducing and hyaluronan-binding protein
MSTNCKPVIIVFADMDISVNARWIKVFIGASFIIGGNMPGCGIKSKIVLTFYGPRSSTSDMGEDSGMPLGTKGLAALPYSYLQMISNFNGPSWAMLSQDANPGDTQIVLNVNLPVNSSWEPGSQIVIASTAQGDASINQHEVVQIVSTSGNIVIIDRPLEYYHSGSSSMRAEVGLLTRNIVFTGDSSSDDSLFGAHLIMRKTAVSIIDGVEFTKAGQKGVLGRYPVHFHHGNEGEMMPMGSRKLKSMDMGGSMPVWIIKNNAVHNNYQRCITIHDTNNVTIYGNVGFNTFGHCFFFEDGAEELNLIDSNLGIYVKPVPNGDPLQLIASDNLAAVFWITNPNNTIVNNNAVGGISGFWFDLPVIPTGMSNMLHANDTYLRPRYEPLLQFYNNTAHSASLNGFFMDDMENIQGIPSGNTPYTPMQAPYNVSSLSSLPQVTANFQNLISYNNGAYGLFTRGGPIAFTNSLLINNGLYMNADQVTLCATNVTSGNNYFLRIQSVSTVWRNVTNTVGGVTAQVPCSYPSRCNVNLSSNIANCVNVAVVSDSLSTVKHISIGLCIVLMTILLL